MEKKMICFLNTVYKIILRMNVPEMTELTYAALFYMPLRKHTYSNILKILQPKTGKFPDKNYDIFHISAQNTDCGYSLELPR